MERDSFNSRLGFILVSAGCAIGIGNVWKFPYVTGANGGGVFVLFYLLFLVLMGVPVMTMELAVGRASRKSAVGGYKALEPKGSKWHIHGWFCMAGCYLLMMYYTTVSGWMVGYFFKFLTGRFEGIAGTEGAADQVAGIFGSMLGSTGEMMLWMGLTVLLGFLVVSTGVQTGLERITKVMMLCLLGLIVVLAVHSLTLKGAGEGVAFYLLPNLARAREVGIWQVIIAAMNQSFFTLSLGVGAMEIFGSYMADDRTLFGESIQIGILDTFVALTLFFLFMTFASFSTVTAVFENLLASCMDNFGWSRKKAVLINLVFVFAASIPCVLGYNLWSGLHLIRGGDVLDSEDFIVSNLLLPLGSLIFLLFCTFRFGWGFDRFLEEANKGRGLKMKKWMKPFFQFVVPVLILVILVEGLK